MSKLDLEREKGHVVLRTCKNCISGGFFSSEKSGFSQKVLAASWVYCAPVARRDHQFISCVETEPMSTADT